MICIANKRDSKNRRRILAGILIIAIAIGAFAHKSGDIIPALEKIAAGIGSVNTTENPDDQKIKLQNEILDRTISKLKNEGKNKSRIIVDAGGGLGGGVDGGGAGCTIQSTKIGDSNYFVRVKVTAQESTIDQNSGQTVTYTYADVDEYEKITGNTVWFENATGSIVTDLNLTDEEYLNSRASIPDLDPEKLLIVSVQEPGSPEVNEFTNFYLTYDNNVFSAFC